MNTSQPTTQTQKILIPWYLYLVIGFTALMIVGAMVFILQQMENIHTTHDPFYENISDIEIKITKAHLWFEEILSNDRSENIEMVRELLDQAERRIQATIGGDHDESQYFYGAPDTHKNRSQFHLFHGSHFRFNIKEPLGEVEAKLVEFRDTLEQRYRIRLTSGPGTNIDQRFDRIFTELLEETGELKKIVKVSKANQLSEYRAVQITLIFICLVVAVFLAVIMHRLERRRAENLLAVQRSEESLRKSEEQFRNIVESSPMRMHMYKLEPDGRLVFTGANPAADAILKIDNRQFIGKTVEKAFPLAIKTEIPDRYRRACSHGESWHIEQIDYEDQQIKGAFEVHAFQTSPGKMAAMFLDITDRKKMEKELRENEAKYRQLVQNAPAAIYEFDMERLRFINVNDVMCEYLGYGREEFLELDPYDLLTEDSKKILTDLINEVFAGKSDPDPVEYKIRGKNNREFWVLVNSKFFFENGIPKRATAVVHNLTELKCTEKEKKALEAKLHQAQKMEAIGTLAGGIAHDFNNILSAIVGYSEMALAHITGNSQVRQHIGQVLKAGLRAKDLVKQILAISRHGKQERKPVQIQLIIKEALKLLRAALPTTIEIHQNIPTESGHVLADPTQIHQVMMNLCTNAFHAMQDKGGILKVKLASVEIDARNTAYLDLKPGPYLKLSVSDTGHGMDQDIQKRIFDPYFTTKEKDMGTGMGLAVVHGIVSNHGGTITIDSEIGMGSTFHILLPRLEEETDYKTEGFTPLPTGDQRILFVDDEK